MQRWRAGESLSETAKLRPRGPERRIPGSGTRAVRQAAEDQAGLRSLRRGRSHQPRPSSNVPWRRAQAGPEDRGLQRVGCEGVQLCRPDAPGREHFTDWSSASGLDRGEWRSPDQGKGRRPRTQWRQGEAARTGRLCAAVHDRPGRPGGRWHVCERARARAAESVRTGAAVSIQAAQGSRRTG